MVNKLFTIVYNLFITVYNLFIIVNVQKKLKKGMQINKIKNQTWSIIIL